MPSRGRRLDERPCLAPAQRAGQRTRDIAEERGVGGIERARGIVSPQVKKAPAAVLVGEDGRRDVGDSVPAEHLTPDEAGCQIAAGRSRQQRRGRAITAQPGPAVDGSGVLRLDQRRQLRQTRHVGQGSRADLGHRVGEQPHVGVEADHLAQHVKNRAPERPVLQVSVGERDDPLPGPGQPPHTRHQVSVCPPGRDGPPGRPPRFPGYPGARSPPSVTESHADRHQKEK